VPQSEPLGGAGGKLQTPTERREMQTVVGVVMTQYFILNAGVMSGFEAVLGLIIFDAYGWGQREGFRVWGPLTAMLLCFFCKRWGVGRARAVGIWAHPSHHRTLAPSHPRTLAPLAPSHPHTLTTSHPHTLTPQH